MPKSSPITREHILEAMTYVGTDPALWPHRSSPKVYVVIDPRTGASLPPKLVLATAAEMATGDRRHRIFSGGQDTNKRLAQLGFSVVEKAAAAEPMSPPTVSDANDWPLTGNMRVAAAR